MSVAAIENGTQVLTFRLGDGQYCVGIDYIAEIVDGGEMTAIPNSEDYVEGVTDLRGRTTTIINLSRILDGEDLDHGNVGHEGGNIRNRIVILDPESAETDGAVGWLVSDVREVRHVSQDALETEAVSDTDEFRGILRDDEDGFVLWVNPHELAV